VIKNARLEEENARLKKLLQRHNSGVSVLGEQLEASTAEATVSVDEYRHITDKCNELNKHYQEATQRIKYLERKNVAVMQKNKDMKENVRAWQDYCDRHLGKQRTKMETRLTNDASKTLTAIQNYENMLNVPSSPRSISAKTPQSPVGQDRSSPGPMIPLTNVTFPSSSLKNVGIDREDSTRKQTGIAAALEHAEEQSPSVPRKNIDSHTGMDPIHAGVAFLGMQGSDKLGSSQTTEDEIAERDRPTTQVRSPTEDDDMPQFVSERSLKRKRKQPTGFRVHTDYGLPEGTPTRPIQVKEEMFSSPPAERSAAYLLRKQTIDLDELGPNVILTPRKQLRRTFSIHSNLTGTLRNQRSSSAPFSGPFIKTEPYVENGQITSVDEAPTETMETTGTRAISEPGGAVAQNVLQPLDANITPRANAGTPHKRIKREKDLQQKYDVLAESGETPPPLDERERRRPPKLALARYNQRVRAHKDTRTPVKNARSTPKTAPAKTTAAQFPTPPSTVDRSANTPSGGTAQRKLPASEPRLDTRSGAHTDRRPVWSMGPPIEPTRKAPTSPPKKQVRLRDKQIADLTYYDFKPNPKYNQGYTHAFAETVRKRSDRLCLPGCVNPTCCGSTFRALASAAPPLTSSQEDKLLEDYLGDAYDSFGLTQMSPGEREEVLLQARTRQMAKEHGKHRQAYEGRRSPPGFWRVGFPSTQEQEEDREKALKMQQDIVRERYLEAMRGNGKWMFRDE
jgi:hypothetical protein